MTECAIVRISDIRVYKEWPDFPRSIDTPDGGRLVSPVGAEHFGLEFRGYRFVERIRVNWDKPSPDHVEDGPITHDLQPLTITLTRPWRLLTAQEITDRDANTRAARISAFADDPIATLLFWMAKDPPPADPTQAQFRTWLESKWPA